MISKVVLKVAERALKKYRKKLKNPIGFQEKILKEIISRNKNSEFGLKHNFKGIEDFTMYQKYVPVEDYSTNQYFFEKTLQKDNVLTKDPIVHWAQSSGTTGSPKIIPITDDALQKWSDGSSRQFFAYLCDSPGNEKILDGKFFTYVGQADLERIRGIPLGYISGIASSRMKNPILLKRFIPTQDILNLRDWKERFWKTMMYVISQDIRLVTGITTVVLNFLRTIQITLPTIINEIKDPKTQLKVQNAIVRSDEVDFGMLWPNLNYIASTGVMVESYRPLIRNLLGDIVILEMYSATEGHFAFQMHEDEPGMYLNFDNYFFEFRELANPEKIVLLDEVKKNTQYELIVTTTNGLYRYNMHDIIYFISTDPPKILVKGRTGNVLNIGSEKITEDQLAFVMKEVMKHLNCCQIDYVLSASTALPFRHKLYIEILKSKKKGKEQAKLISEIYDKLMDEINPSYTIARGQALIEPEVHILEKGAFRKINENTAKRTGQAEHSKLLHIIQPEHIEKIIDDNLIEWSYIPDEN